jgi:hypothetical protein
MRKYSFVYLILFIWLLSACAPPSPTATPTPEPIAGVDVPIASDGAQVRVTGATILDEIPMGMTDTIVAEEGFSILRVTIQVSEGTIEEVSAWTVNVLDSADTLYPSIVTETGLFAGGSDIVAWSFSVPEDETTLELVLPDGTAIDISSVVSAANSAQPTETPAS